MLPEVKQPPRGPGDGPINVSRPTDDHFTITAEQDGVTTRLEMSAYNAWRVFGCLAFFLGIKLPANIAKKITLGSTDFVFESDAKTLGDRTALDLSLQKLADETRGKLIRPGDKR